MLISKFENHNVSEEILNLEREYNIFLPKEYKDFLCRYNGGYTPKTKIKAGKISSDIRGFYGVGNVALSLNTLELQEWIHKKIMPIATDSFGNYFAIGLCDDISGKIFFFDHEVGYRGEYIAESLKAFLQYCKSDRISEASRRSIEEREAALIANGRGDVITDDLRRMWQAEIDKYGNMVQEEVVINSNKY